MVENHSVCIWECHRAHTCDKQPLSSSLRHVLTILTATLAPRGPLSFSIGGSLAAVCEQPSGDEAVEEVEAADPAPELPPCDPSCPVHTAPHSTQLPSGQGAWPNAQRRFTTTLQQWVGLHAQQ